ncbi:xylose transport system permease protein XylH [bacterium BMS3Abin02]|nr:xylose transport system permease protein XylH [bacterium BMS3Abin02]GBE21870.1 xylose transport system permease protein XylH [bacterium BMS3Bbin01]
MNAGESADKAAAGAATEAAPTTFARYVGLWWANVRSGQLGSLPIIVGLGIIVGIFGSLDSTFFAARNFTNLLLQMAGIATIAIGAVFILLLAEIDLAVAYVSAVGGVVMTMLLRPGNPGWPWWLAIGVALAATTLIGMIHALIVTKAGVPSFVVTLAGYLTWFGVVLILTTTYSTAGTILIEDPVAVGIAGSFLSNTWGWILAGVAVVGYSYLELSKARTRGRRGLRRKPLAMIALQVGVIAVGSLGAVYYANKDRGVPMATLILLIALVFWTFVTNRTRFGRHIYAVGGNAEAARRAGINVDRVRIAVFMIGGLMAGMGGIILASRLRSVATNTGGGSLLLNVIAAAVIGGTSLFGGKGRVVDAFLGAAVIVSVNNGMNLLGLAAGTKFVITGLVLLAAVLVDALSKKGRASRGFA